MKELSLEQLLEEESNVVQNLYKEELNKEIQAYNRIYGGAFKESSDTGIGKLTSLLTI